MTMQSVSAVKQLIKECREGTDDKYPADLDATLSAAADSLEAFLKDQEDDNLNKPMTF